MRPYFEKMTPLGNELHKVKLKNSEENLVKISDVERRIAELEEKIKTAGLSAEKINTRGQLTVWQRLEYLVDPGTWTPLHTIFNPEDNEDGGNSVVDGIGKINGRWAVIIGFDNKMTAGAWVPGQPENVLRVTELVKRLRVPLVWLVNCSGVKLTEQQEVYADRRGGGTVFFRNAELQKLGIPVLAGIFGTNPAAGGYHGISPTILLAHKECNIAVGGAGIVNGMSPKGFFDEKGAEKLVEITLHLSDVPPGRVDVHYNSTGFFRHVFDTEEEVLDALKDYMAAIPAYHPRFFRAATPSEPKFSGDDLNQIIPMNQKAVYSFEEVLARIVDDSEHMEFKPDYGPEVYAGLVKIDGFLTGVIGNKLGILPQGYPEYADYPGIGGKLYRQGLIKMNEFVGLCGRDRIPLIWFQDTSGMDVGDVAEKAELLGLGQALIYSIEQTDIPMMLVVLRKGSAAAHYIMGGPTANNHCAVAIGTPATEIYVMHGETAAAATFARRLVKEKDSGRPLQPIIDKMNALAQQYYDYSRPIYCAKRGFVDEIVSFSRIRRYMTAFVGCAYQNPPSLCAHHQMVLPRIIKG